MYFATLADFVHMDGHGAYVWSAYAIALLIIGTLILLPILDRRRFLREEALRQRRAASAARQSTANAGSVPGPRPRLTTQLPDSGG